MQPSTTKLKICGITNLADARYCAGAGVDYLGFIQHRPSPRFIEPAKAKEIISWLYGPEPVGVFVYEGAPNEDTETRTWIDQVNETIRFVGFSMIQIHGTLSPDLLDLIEVPIIKAFSVSPSTTPEALMQQALAYAEANYFLLDTAKAGMWGGTGEAFDWDTAKEATETYDVFIAGGLNASNIEEVIRTVNPYAIDIASGVEESPGVKDFDKLADVFDILSELQS